MHDIGQYSGTGSDCYLGVKTVIAARERGRNGVSIGRYRGRGRGGGTCKGICRGSSGRASGAGSGSGI